ncbi:hypothetical protein [Achromobacter xylosoxidans]|nr:hypothetical protein [Achromobacter xylosoxidans]BEG76051.1 hypothetical protein HBIAX_03124 [Achromobacter xylosoxidans]
MSSRITTEVELLQRIALGEDSRLQKYRLTEAGQRLLQHLQGTPES